MSAEFGRSSVRLVLGVAILVAGCQTRPTEPPPVSQRSAPEAERGEGVEPAAAAAGNAGVPSATGGLAAPVPGSPMELAKEPPVAEPPTPPAGWGHLRGRFVYDGPPPAQNELRVTADVEFCGPHRPLDESLVVDSTSFGIANIVVSLYRAGGSPPPAVHPSYAAAASDKIVLDNSKCRFDPHIIRVRTSQTLQIVNTDAIAHNTKIDTLKNPPINPTLPAGGVLEHRFQVSEAIPARISCSIHPWMIGWVIVKEDPYFAVSGKDGSFEIRNLPAGSWTFQVWHEKARFVTEVKQNGQPVSWSKGRFAIEITPDGTADLGELRLGPGLFGKS